MRKKINFPLKEKKNNKTIFKCINSLISQNNKIIANITTQFFFNNIPHKYHLSQKKHGKYHYVNDKMGTQQKSENVYFQHVMTLKYLLLTIYLLYRE